MCMLFRILSFSDTPLGSQTGVMYHMCVATVSWSSWWWSWWWSWSPSTLRQWSRCCCSPWDEGWQTHCLASLWPWSPWPSPISSCQVRAMTVSSVWRFCPRTAGRTAGGSWAVCQDCSPRCTWRRGRWRRWRGPRGWPRRCCWPRRRPGLRSGPGWRLRTGPRSGTRCVTRHRSWCWTRDTEPRSNSHGAWNDNLLRKWHYALKYSVALSHPLTRQNKMVATDSKRFKTQNETSFEKNLNPNPLILFSCYMGILCLIN